MKTIDISSDTHFDFWVDINQKKKDKIKRLEQLFSYIIPEIHSDILLLAGDLSHYNELTVLALELLRKHYKAIAVVHGNHDLYLIDHLERKRYGECSLNKARELSEMIDSVPGVYYMDGDVVELGGIRILGSSFWYDYSYGEMYFKKPAYHFDRLWQTWSDNVYMMKEGGRFDNLSFCAEKVNKALSVEGPVDVVVSHMIPLNELVERKYAFDETTSFFVFNGSRVIEKFKPKVWVYGHTHTPFEGRIGETLFLNNALGYAPSRAWFDQEPERWIRTFRTVGIG